METKVETTKHLGRGISEKKKGALGEKKLKQHIILRRKSWKKE